MTDFTKYYFTNNLYNEVSLTSIWIENRKICLTAGKGLPMASIIALTEIEKIIEIDILLISCKFVLLPEHR